MLNILASAVVGSLYDAFNNFITEAIATIVLAVFIGVPVLIIVVIGRVIGLWRWGR